MRPSNWHKSVIFHPILILFLSLFFRDKLNDDKFKVLSPWLKIMVFGPILAPRSHMGNIVHSAHGPKTNLKMSGRVLAFPFNSYLKIEAAMQIYVCDL